jgi:ribulose-5-phosphate 4-epimerase/fuculose-1-phosphate aldolase
MRYVDDAGACVLAAAKDMLRRGLVEGTAGIISARQLDGTVVITPAAIDYADMELEDLVVLTSEGRPRAAKDGDHRPRRGCSTWPATGPAAALHVTALVERSARITWGARSL